MSKAEKDAEGGKKALAHHGAVPMLVVYGLGEKNIRVAGTVLAAKGYVTLDMRYIADMGVEPPDLRKFHPGDWGLGIQRRETQNEVGILALAHSTQHGFTHQRLLCPRRTEDWRWPIRLLGIPAGPRL
jgi:hypothetical protein